MKEEQLLDKTLEILGENGADEAYKYILSEKNQLEEYSSQLYNFLYCLSAVTGAKVESLAWIKESIIDERYWYRPEVFEDSDLDSIRNEAVFLDCRKISDTRYYEALKSAKTLCTWDEVKNTKLALVLHGNQQNMFSDRGYWKFMRDEGYQVEYVQSKIIDSYMLYRWEDNAETQLDSVIGKLSWDSYSTHALCGFSAGCDEILKTLLNKDIKCEKIILQSPWIPIIDEKLDEVMLAIENMQIRIICGSNDDDCLTYAEKLAKEADIRGLNCELQVISGLGHSYPL